jgi:hypothetical protein
MPDFILVWLVFIQFRIVILYVSTIAQIGERFIGKMEDISE